MPNIDFLRFMARKNISRKEMADILGVKRSSISQYISGAHGVVWEKVEMLVDLGISPVELFGEKLGNKMKETIIEEYLSKSQDDKKMEPLEMMKEGMIEILKRI
jgi:transcriptional regulator with XRE-family HTH domain